MIIDFTKIIGPRQSRSGNFEELVSQMLVLELGAVSLDGAGGDGGIDCFLESRSGALTVFQSKYFTDRLTPSRRRQIEQSFKRISNKTNLINWVLCLPIDPTPGELSWFAGLTAGHMAGEWWGATRLRAMLSRHLSLCEQFFPSTNLEAQFAQFSEDARAILAAISRSHSVQLGSETAQKNISTYLKRAEAIGSMLKEDLSIMGKRDSNTIIAVDFSEIYLYMTNAHRVGVEENVVDYCVDRSPFPLVILPPWMLEMCQFLDVIKKRVSVMQDFGSRTYDGRDLLSRFMKTYETNPGSDEALRAYLEINGVTGTEGAARFAGGISRLLKAIDSGKIQISTVDILECIRDEELDGIYDYFLRRRRGRAACMVDAVALRLVQKKWVESPDSIRVLSSSLGFHGAAAWSMGQRNPVRSSSDYAYFIRAIATDCSGADISEAALDLVRVTSFTDDLSFADLLGLNPAEKKKLLHSFDRFAPLYKKLLWPVDGMIIGENRLKRSVQGLGMEEFYAFISAESEVAEGFRLWWERAYEWISLLRDRLPSGVEEDVRALEARFARAKWLLPGNGT
jgi:hypothetical protein